MVPALEVNNTRCARRAVQVWSTPRRQICQWIPGRRRARAVAQQDEPHRFVSDARADLGTAVYRRASKSGRILVELSRENRRLEKAFQDLTGAMP